MFHQLSIPPDLLASAGVCRVTHCEAVDTYGCRLTLPGADMAGLMFPYFDPLTKNRVSARVRRDNPERKPDGRPENKYVSAFADNRHLFFPPVPAALLKDTAVRVVFVESEKAALAVTAWAHRCDVWVLAIGTGGCGGWQGKTDIKPTVNGGRERDGGPLPDFGFLTWEGREVVICFDSNAATNSKVQRERGKLARVLVGLSAKVKVATVPALPNVNGPDDLIGLHGDEAFGKVLSDAEVFSYAKHLPRFFVTDKGTFAVEYGKDGAAQSTWLASPLKVEAYTRDDRGCNWGRLLTWDDPEGRGHTWPMPMEALGSTEGTEVFRRLLADGLKLATGRKEKARLLEYLQDTIPQRAVVSVPRVGWHSGAFVLPDDVIGSSAAAIYQSPFEQEHHYRVAGTLADWQTHVAQYCRGNTRLIFAVSAAFAGPMLAVIGEESGGFHFRGPSSTGKSTAQLMAGSVWGGGGPHGFGHTWRATSNGLEAVAEVHNDGLLCLDELGQVDAREAGEVAYLLANGAGKARMTKTIGARRSLRWRLLILSSGELSLASHMLTGGRKARAGQEVRLLDIPADAGAGLGVFEHLHGMASADELSRLLCENARKSYGAPIRPFLRFVSEHWQEVEISAKEERRAFSQKHIPPGAVGEVSRAAGRFALVGAAGELATEAGITGWPDGVARQAAERLFGEWLGQRTIGSADEDKAIRQVRAFLEAHGASRFQMLKPGNDGAERIINRAGFKRETDEGIEYLILPETFKNEVCGGYDSKMVTAALHKRGLLTHSVGRMQFKVRLPELGDDSVWVYCIRARLFNADE
jgi:uncharacterized protein (DUF927 family)